MTTKLYIHRKDGHMRALAAAQNDVDSLQSARGAGRGRGKDARSVRPRTRGGVRRRRRRHSNRNERETRDEHGELSRRSIR